MEVVKQRKNNQVLALMLESRRRSTLHLPCFLWSPSKQTELAILGEKLQRDGQACLFDVMLWDSWTDLAVPWIDAVTQAARDRLVLPGTSRYSIRLRLTGMLCAQPGVWLSQVLEAASAHSCLLPRGDATVRAFRKMFPADSLEWEVAPRAQSITRADKDTLWQ